MLLQNKKIIITGTNRGIGRAILTKCAENGAEIFACSRKEYSEHLDYCKMLSEKYNVKIHNIYFDFGNPNDIKKGAIDIKKISSVVDGLVNVVSQVVNPQNFMMSSMESIKSEFEINFFSTILFTQYISRIMTLNKSGSIVNISSVAGLDGNTGMIGYVSSKAAIIGATKNMALDLGKYNIRVNSIAPGLTDTDMGNIWPKESIEEITSRLVFKRLAKPEEIAEPVVFLLSNMSSFITGQILRVDGGGGLGV